MWRSLILSAVLAVILGKSTKSMPTENLTGEELAREIIKDEVSELGQDVLTPVHDLTFEQVTYVSYLGLKSMEKHYAACRNARLIGFYKGIADSQETILINHEMRPNVLNAVSQAVQMDNNDPTLWQSGATIIDEVLLKPFATIKARLEEIAGPQPNDNYFTQLKELFDSTADILTGYDLMVKKVQLAIPSFDSQYEGDANCVISDELLMEVAQMAYDHCTKLDDNKETWKQFAVTTLKAAFPSTSDSAIQTAAGEIVESLLMGMKQSCPTDWYQYAENVDQMTDQEKLFHVLNIYLATNIAQFDTYMYVKKDQA